ncbi:MAG: hypothetical protein WA771_04785, partial [Chthoniobacterales bacterium]
ASQTLKISCPKAAGGTVTFDYYYPTPDADRPKVLVLIPGYNGSGRAQLTKFWTQFADRFGLVLLAPTFHATIEEIQSRSGYYYPDLWSGDVLLDAIAEIKQRVDADCSQFYLYGHSAGAHFAHRFALWRPDRVGAFVAYSAAWWDSPTEAIAEVPALIMCGEDDPRYDATLTFFLESKAFDAPWVWRGYRSTGHESTPTVVRMAATFLENYLTGEPDAPLIGDIQTYETTNWSERSTVPEDARVRLPSPKVAEIWRREN